MSKGRYGIHGGQYISETLMNELIHLEECYEYYKKDPEFNAELNKLLKEYAGRPSLLYYAEKMTKDLGGAKIYLKREDLNHTGSHKINNALGQALLAKKMGKTRLIAETGMPGAWETTRIEGPWPFVPVFNGWVRRERAITEGYQFFDGFARAASNGQYAWDRVNGFVYRVYDPSDVDYNID